MLGFLSLLKSQSAQNRHFPDSLHGFCDSTAAESHTFCFADCFTYRHEGRWVLQTVNGAGYELSGVVQAWKKKSPFMERI